VLLLIFVGNNILSNAILAGYQSDFTVQVDEAATVTMNNYFYLIGTITLINNGVWIYDSSSYMDFNVDAYWVNLGLMQVINYSNDYIQGTYFPGLSTATDAGTMVNMGTITFSNHGGLDFQYGTGTFLQCKHGIMKWGYGVDGTNPGSVTLPSITIDGFIGFYFESASDVPASGSSLFDFVPEKDGNLPFGSFTSLFDTVTKGPGVLDSPRIVCFSAGGSVDLYGLVDDVKCPQDYYQTLLPIAVGNACSDLPASIKNLEDTASCPAGADCGIKTGSPAGEPNPNSAHSLAVHLAFLVSLVCLLLKF